MEGTLCEIQQLLDSKEERSRQQKIFLEKYSTPVVSVSLISPGRIKKNFAYEAIFRIIRETLDEFFIQNNFKINNSLFITETSGDFMLFSVKASSQDLKRSLTNLEDSHPLGRLWDLDVIDTDFRILSRTDIGFTPRKCLLCGEEAKVCARSRKHSYQDLMDKIHEMLKKYIFINRISEIAHDALVKEVKLTPKPGLVDCNNNGAHKDMNLFMFLKSAKVLQPFFGKFICCGMETYQDDFPILFTRLRKLGIEAEQVMFSVTGNVNTHKGAIFSFALVLGSIGRLYMSQEFSYTLHNLLEQVRNCASNISNELSTESVDKDRRDMYKKYNLKGARGEAETGYETITKYVYPIFEKLHLSDERHRLLAGFLSLMAFTGDTNIVHRGGINALQYVQEKALKALRDKDLMGSQEKLVRFMSDFDSEMIIRNLSPGGSADLLALSCFLFDFFNLKKCLMKN